MEKARPAFIDFEDDFRAAMWEAERATKVPFTKLRRLIGENGGVNTAKILLEDREKFTVGFKRLHDAGLIKYSLESLVLKYESKGLFTPGEIENARWRLANADLAEDNVSS